MNFSPEQLDPRLAVGVVGAVLLLFGARIYRLAIVAPGSAAGVWAAVNGAALLGQPTTGAPVLIAGACLGIIGAAVLHFAERLAVRGAGAIVAGGLANALAPLALGGPAPWYVPVAGALLGLLLFPRIYKALLKVLMPVLGALCVAWAAGRPEDLLLIGGLASAGVVFQLILGGRGKKKEGEEA